MRALPASILLAMTLASAAANAQPAPQPEPPRPYRNNAMRISGIVLTSLGSAVLAGGLVMLGLDQASSKRGCEDFCGLGTAIGGLILVPISVGFAGIGVPLWVVGAQPPKGVAGALPPAVPRFSLGPVPDRAQRFDHGLGAAAEGARPWAGSLTWSM